MLELGQTRVMCGEAFLNPKTWLDKAVGVELVMEIVQECGTFHGFLVQ